MLESIDEHGNKIYKINFSGFHGVPLQSTVSRLNWDLGMLVFVEGGKSRENPSEQGLEPTTNSTHI